MPHPRTFTQMVPGDVVGAGATTDRWEVVGTSGPAGFSYFLQDILDLRALTAGKESGVEVASCVLQEAGPWSAVITGDRGYFMVIDMLTTTTPTEEFISDIWDQPALPGTFPGFLIPVDTATSPEDQSFNPSQVTWGLWRLIAVSTMNQLGANLAMDVQQSGFFGLGEPIVAPGLCWTRVVIPYQDADQITIPSANLVTQGLAVDLSTAEELTQMMRAVQR